MVPVFFNSDCQNPLQLQIPQQLVLLVFQYTLGPNGKLQRSWYHSSDICLFWISSVSTFLIVTVIAFRDQKMHWLVFEEGGLPDGTEVAYYSRGKVPSIPFCTLFLSS